MSRRLDRLARVRAAQERVALGELGRARHRAAAAHGSVDAARGAYRDRPQAGPQILTPLLFRALELQGVAAHEVVEEARAAAEGADFDVERAERVWTMAARRHDSVERLADRARSDAAVLAQKAAQRALDELAVLRVGRR